MLKIATDLGRSRTRKIVNQDKARAFISGYKEIAVTAPNRFDAPNKDEDFVIVEAPQEFLRGRRFVRGETANFHKGVSRRADNQNRKFEQEETFVNVVAAIATSIVQASAQASERFNPSIKLGLCIPCGEFFSEGATEMKKLLSGLYHVRFPLLSDTGVAFTINESEIMITPEGVIALRALTKEDRKALTKGKTSLILDCGYGSLDITVLVDGKPLGDCARSFPIGGITFEAILSAHLEERGVFVSPDALERAYTSGLVSQGKDDIDVTEQVNKSKKAFAAMLVQRAKSVLVQAGIPYTEVSAVCPIGRSFTVSSNSEIVNLFDMFQEAWGCDVDLIDVSFEGDLEYANVRGVAAAM